MGILISKTYLYQILFALCVAIPYLNNYELTFTIWLITLVVTIQKKYSTSVIQLISCYIAILLIASFWLFFKDHGLYYIIRDITYMLKPVFGILIGYQLFKKHIDGFQTIIYTGVFVAVLHLIILILAVVIHHASTVNDLRLYGGYFSDFEVYALIFLLFYEKFEIGFSKKKTQRFSIIIAVSIFMYLARTNFIQFIILFLAMKGYFKINKTSIKVLAYVLSLTIIGYSTILFINPKRNGAGIEALLYKIKIAPIEPFKTKVDRDDWKDFNDNYRSYETIMTIKQTSNEGTLATLFGQGIGSKVDLKQEVMLGDMKLRYISFLHNSYMTVLLKSGLLGMIFYFIPFYILGKKSKSQVQINQSINLLLLGTVIFLIISNYIFMGLYNLLDSKSILIGLFLGYRGIKKPANGLGLK